MRGGVKGGGATGDGRAHYKGQGLQLRTEPGAEEVLDAGPWDSEAVACEAAQLEGHHEDEDLRGGELGRRLVMGALIVVCVALPRRGRGDRAVEERQREEAPEDAPEVQAVRSA